MLRAKYSLSPMSVPRGGGLKRLPMIVRARRSADPACSLRRISPAVGYGDQLACFVVRVNRRRGGLSARSASRREGDPGDRRWSTSSPERAGGPAVTEGQRPQERHHRIAPVPLPRRATPTAAIGGSSARRSWSSGRTSFRPQQACPLGLAAARRSRRVPRSLPPCLPHRGFQPRVPAA